MPWTAARCTACRTTSCYRPYSASKTRTERSSTVLWLYKAAAVWQIGYGLDEAGMTKRGGHHVVLTLTLRLAKAAMSIWEHSVGSCSTTGISTSGTSGSGGRRAGSSRGSSRAAAAMPAAILEPSACPRLAVLALEVYQD